MSKKFFAGLIMVLGMVIIAAGNSYAGGKDKPAAKHLVMITGNISNMPQITVVLEMLRANDSLKIVDSQRSDAAGHFVFKHSLSEPGLYRIHFTQDKFILLSLDKGDVKITAGWPISDYTVSGSPASEQLKLYVDTVIGYMTLMNTTSRRIDSMKAIGNAEQAQSEENMRKEINLQFRSIVKRYSDATAYEPNAIISARILSPQEDLQYYLSFDKNLDTRFPGTIMTKEFHQFVTRLKETMPEPNEIGDKAPDLTLMDTAGKKITLSSLQGKYVLLDFWASWCGPCRAENPNVLAAYKKFQDKNFTILAVSLDNNKAKWIEAVHHDALLWSQVSDLLGWQSPAAAKYGVHGIPMNFLIDPKGVIVAKNLRGPLLEEKLKEIFP